MVSVLATGVTFTRPSLHSGPITVSKRIRRRALSRMLLMAFAIPLKLVFDR
jgi:hypothetical protein